MEWLNDKKNQPIIIGVLVAVLIGAGVFIYMTQFAGSGSSDTAAQGTTADMGAAPTTAGPTPGTPSGAASTPSTAPSSAPSSARATTANVASAGGSTAAGNQMAGVTPMESWRDDPFQPIGYKPHKYVAPPKPRLIVPMPMDIVRIKPIRPNTDDREFQGPPQPTRRMAGLLLNGRVYAIIEVNGKTEVRQPGDMLDDRMAMVDSIERDKVILKTTTDRVPRYLTVRMAGATHQDTSATAVATPPPGARTPYGGGGYPRGGTP